MWQSCRHLPFIPIKSMRADTYVKERGRQVTGWTRRTRKSSRVGTSLRAATSSPRTEACGSIQQFQPQCGPRATPTHPAQQLKRLTASKDLEVAVFNTKSQTDWMDHLQAALQHKLNTNLKKCSFYLLHVGGKKKSFHSKKKTGMLLLEIENWVCNIFLITSLQTLQDRHKGSKVAFLSSAHRCWLTSL